MNPNLPAPSPPEAGSSSPTAPGAVQKDLFLASAPSKVTLTVKGLIPGKKNCKMIVTKGPHGRPLSRPMLITKPDYQKRIEEIVESFVSQLRSACQTASGGTLTGSSLRSWTAFSLPADDSFLNIPVLIISGELCEPGEEGAEISIVRL